MAINTFSGGNPINSLQAAGKNAVIGGGMDIWQRGTSFSIAASTGNTYFADRWSTKTGTNQALTVSRQATNDTTNLPNIQYCFRYQRNSGQTGTSGLEIFNSLESSNSIPLAGKTVTLSFYARKGADFSGSLSAYLISGTGTDQNRGTGSYTGEAYPINNQSVSLTTTWQRFTFTGTVASTATELCAYLNWNPTGTAGTNDYFEVTGVQLELGTTATTFSRAGGTIQGELAACQRYYEKSFNQGTAPGASTSAGQIGNSGGADSLAYFINQYPFKVVKRGAPVITTYDSVGNSGRVMTYSSGAGGTNNVTPGGVDTIGDASFRIYLNNKANCNGFVFHYVADAEL